LNTVQDAKRPIVPQVNPAKPPKRALHHDADDSHDNQRQPATKTGQPYQQLDAKRRKTLEQNVEVADPRRSVLAPPIRQSNVRKVIIISLRVNDLLTLLRKHLNSHMDTWLLRHPPIMLQACLNQP
jgi:hypothetical protein